METLQNLAANFDDIRVLLFYYWIEACMIALVGLGLLGLRTDYRNIIKIGALHGLAVFIIRGLYKSFDIPFGTHTLILVLIMSLLISKFTSLRWGVSLTASLLGIVTLVLGESLILPHFHRIIGMSLEALWANPWTHILAGYVGDVLLIFVAVVIGVTNFSLVHIRD